MSMGTSAPPAAISPETRIVRTAPGMGFDVSVAGDPGRPLVLAEILNFWWLG
jgi:hypothetical protein